MPETIQFEDNRVKVKEALKQAGIAWLYEAAGEIEAQTKRNTRVDRPGAPTKSSFRYEVDEGKGEATVGSDQENAVWEEFGTGEYALKHDGRKTPWYVPVDTYQGTKKPTYNGKVVIVQGRNGKKYYKTNGKRGTRALFKAFEGLKGKLQKSYQNKVKGAMNS